MLSVTDSYPIELIFPIRQGRSDQQLGKKNKDKESWSSGIKPGMSIPVSTTLHYAHATDAVKRRNRISFRFA